MTIVFYKGFLFPKLKFFLYETLDFDKFESAYFENDNSFF